MSSRAGAATGSPAPCLACSRRESRDLSSAHPICESGSRPELLKFAMRRAPVSSKKSSRLAVLGAGKMGSILLQALLGQRFVTPSQVRATVKHAEKAARLSRDLGVAVTTDNPAAVAKSDVIVLAVKPQSVAEVLAEVGPQLDES